MPRPVSVIDSKGSANQECIYFISRCTRQCGVLLSCPGVCLAKVPGQVSYKNRSQLSHSTLARLSISFSLSPLPDGTWQSLNYTKKWKTETAFSAQVPSSAALFGIVSSEKERSHGTWKSAHDNWGNCQNIHRKVSRS